MDNGDTVNNSNPNDLINVLIVVGRELDILDQQVEDKTLISEIQSKIDINKIKTTGHTLSEYENAMDVLKINPKDQFELGKTPSTIGIQLTIKNYDHLRRAFDLYHSYRDPRIREPHIVRAETIYESILREAKIQARNSDSKRIQFPLSKVNLPPGTNITAVYELPKLEWKRHSDESVLVSLVLMQTLVGILKQGWMVNPELIRLLNLVKSDALKQIMQRVSMFVKSRITIALQRLADIMYLTNFGILDQTIHFHLIEDMFKDPLEDRTNLPQSEAKDVVNFLNQLRNQFPEIDELSKLSRKIGVLTKPIADETPDFIGFDSSGDAIREILSVIHYTMNHQNIDTQIQTIYETITDPDFDNIVKYYFDPSYELLHTPFLTTIQSTKERMELHYRGSYALSEHALTKEDISEVDKKLDSIKTYLSNGETSSQFIEIWSKLNNYLKINIEALVDKKSKREVYELIKGKEIILNIMTPLLLAKYEGRGFNPLAAKVDSKLASHLKSITGIIAVGSNLAHNDLKSLMDTMFVEAPETKKSSNKAKVPGPPSPKGPPGPPSAIPSPSGKKTGEKEGSNLIPTKMGIGLARIANEYVTGGGERNLHRALVDLIKFTDPKNKD